jgi:hypothetical protein
VIYSTRPKNAALLALKSPVGGRIFRTYVRWRHGLRFRIAGPGDLDELFAFRYRVYAAEGYIDSTRYPDGRFADRYDDASVNVVALQRGMIVGAGRATLPSEAGLPTMACFNPILPAGIDPASIAEMGRFMVDRRLRGKSRMVSIGLSIELRHIVRSKPEIRWLLAFMDEKVRRAFYPFAPFEVLEEQPLERRHIEERARMPGYFEKNSARPVLASAAAF